MKNNKFIIFLISLLTIISILLIVFMFNMINGNIKFSMFNFNNKVSDKIVFDQTYEKTFDEIIINSSSSNIYIKTSEDNSIKAVVYSDEETNVTELDNKLTITTKEKNCIGFCINYAVTKIEVYLPKNYKNNINITNNYGDIEIDEFLNANMEILEESGDVKIIGGNNIKVTNDYGDIKINNANDIDIKESAGDVIIDSVNNVKVENDYGDIKIDKVNNYLDLNNDCGDIELENIVLNKNSSITDSYGDIKIGKTNEIYIDAKTDLGDVKINNNYNKSDINLKITNDCGDIKVSN